MCSSPAGPGSPSGTRPCATTACPILRARQAGSAQAVEQLQTSSGTRQTVITSSRIVNGLQVQVLRDETELEGVRRARDTVLANVSHEFRTPLAAQLASIELLREGLKTSPPEKLDELVLSLERGTLRLTRLIDNLLESVRIESGQLDVRRQSIELADVVDDARALVEALLRQRRQPLEVERARGPGAAGRRHAAHAGVRQSHRQCQQVRARGHRGARRCARGWQPDQRLGRGRRARDFRTATP